MGGAEVPADGTPNYDEISWGTAWLFEQFCWDNTFAVSDAQMIALQDTFWYLEDEIGALADPTYLNFATAAGTLDGVLDITTDAMGAFNISVMNQTRITTTGEQRLRRSVLYCPPGVADGGTTAMLLGLAMSGLALVSRRMRG